MANRTCSIILRQARSLLIGVTLTVFATGVSADESAYDVHVSGLACPFCVYGLERSIGKIEDVAAVTVSLKNGLIRITVRDGATLDEALVHETIKDAGFTVEAYGSAEPIGDESDDGA